MSNSIPDNVRDELRFSLWKIADEIGWLRLSDQEKAQYYRLWTTEPKIGGRLAQYRDARGVRVYIKDTLMKAYAQTRLADPNIVFKAIGLRNDIKVYKKYKKPHGRLLSDGRVLCWGRARDWRDILLAAHERAHNRVNAEPFAVVFLETDGRFAESTFLAMVCDAAEKLQIKRIAWLDGHNRLVGDSI